MPMFAVIVLCSALTGACETHRVALDGVNELACGAEAQAKAAGAGARGSAGCALWV